MKSLKDTIYESIMNADSLDDQVETAVEWREELESALDKVTDSIKDEEMACAYEYALYKTWKPLFERWNRTSYNDLQFEKFIAFLTYSLNPWVINTSPDDIDPANATIEDFNWSERGEWMTIHVVNMLDEMKMSGPGRSTLSSMRSSGSAWNFFFDQYYIASVVTVVSGDSGMRTMANKYIKALTKIAKYFDLQ